jgi:hypothetical protein
MSEVRLKLCEYGGGQYFGTRHLGGRIRAEAEKLLAGLPAGGVLVLDFTGVVAVTVVFADELVANLTATFGLRVALDGMSDEVGETVQFAVSRREGVRRCT